MQQALSKEITIEELSHTLGSMARGKAPGPDGLLVEFYQCMWQCMSLDFLQMVKKAMASGSFPSGVTEGLIVLLHKGGTR